VSDTDVLQELESELRKVQEQEVAAVKGSTCHLIVMVQISDDALEIKQEFKRARELIQRVRLHPSLQPSPKNSLSTDQGPTKVKVSLKLAALLVYTVGVKCHGINKKEVYAPEHMFSLSETTANKIVKQNMMDFIKHNRTHLVRIYPKGLRLNSSNYEPHRFWSAGAHLVAINWQTYGGAIHWSTFACVEIMKQIWVI
jgi:phosphatidylinositol phospholipase C delta